MRITEISVKNFRSFEDETIALDNYTCLVAPNGTGKSTVLQALNVFFRNIAATFSLCGEGFHHKKTDAPIDITLAFEQLSPNAQEDFADAWEAVELKAKVEQGVIGGIKRKNSMLIAVTLDEQHKNGKQSEIIETLCSKILQYAEKH